MKSAFKSVVKFLGIGVMLILAPGMATAGPGDVEKSGASWWQWALSIPAAVNPLVDPTGEHCLVGQSGGVWYLAGTFGGPTSAERTCTVPAGTAFFVPVINFVNLNAPNVCGQGPDNVSVDDLRAAIAPAIDAAAKLSLTIDGVGVSNVHRTKSGVFAATLPDDNIFDPLCGGPGTVPAGVYSPAVDDGYYGQVNALSAGPHLLHIYAESPSGTIAVDVTYHLNAVATINH